MYISVTDTRVDVEGLGTMVVDYLPRETLSGDGKMRKVSETRRRACSSEQVKQMWGQQRSNQ